MPTWKSNASGLEAAPPSLRRGQGEVITPRRERGRAPPASPSAPMVLHATPPSGGRLLDDAARARAGVIVALAVAVANGLNVVFHFVVARLLVPEEYSLLATLFVILAVVSVPMLSLQAAVAREVVIRLGREGEGGAGLALRETLASLLRKVPLLLAAGTLIAVPAALLTHVQRPFPAIATAIAIVVALPAPIIWGALQGTERFTAFGASQAGYAAVKFAAGVILAAAGFGAAAIMFGVALASVMAVILSLWPLRRVLAASRGLHMVRRRLASPYVTASAVALSLFIALTALDVIVSRVAFSGTTAGAYAAASVGARVLLVIPLAVTTVLFPKVASLRDATRARHYLLVGVAVVGLLSIVAAAIVLAFPGPLLHLAFGHKYDAAAAWIGPLCIAMALYAVADVYLFQFLAEGRSRYWLVLSAVLVIQLAGYALAHGRPMDLVYVQIATGAVLLAASEIFDLRRRRHR